jgi:hypothetical protein
MSVSNHLLDSCSSVALERRSEDPIQACVAASIGSLKQVGEQNMVVILINSSPQKLLPANTLLTHKIARAVLQVFLATQLRLNTVY